eukprot:6209741-Pleurochrysis_carterae.AAC.1
MHAKRPAVLSLRCLDAGRDTGNGLARKQHFVPTSPASRSVHAHHLALLTHSTKYKKQTYLHLVQIISSIAQQGTLLAAMRVHVRRRSCCKTIRLAVTTRS